MGDSIFLGRIAGIRIGINWSVLLLSALLVWTLSQSVLPEALPDRSQALYVALALVAAVLFLASILLHELGHALQARRDDVPIDGITLWLLGGVARFKGGFPTAAAELRIAIAGPVVSAAIGGTFIGIAFIPGIPAEADAVVSYIGLINLLLLAFNMLPALPLDGGRVLRAAIWLRRGDFAAATRSATTVGRVIAMGLIGLGVADFVVFRDIGGLWLAFIGLFVMSAAGAEQRASLARASLAGLRVRDAMDPRPVAVNADATLGGLMDEVARLARRPVFPVVRHGVPVGIVSVDGISGVPREEWADERIAERMTPIAEAPVVAPEDDLLVALQRTSETTVGQALVMDHGALVGLFSPADVARELEARLARAGHNGRAAST